MPLPLALDNEALLYGVKLSSIAMSKGGEAMSLRLCSNLSSVEPQACVFFSTALTNKCANITSVYTKIVQTQRRQEYFAENP